MMNKRIAEIYVPLIFAIVGMLLSAQPVKSEDLLNGNGPITLPGCTSEEVMEALQVMCDCENPGVYYTKRLGLKTKRKDSKEDKDRILKRYLDKMCSDAWNDLLQTSWQDISFDFSNNFMINFMNGGTYLNRKLHMFVLVLNTSVHTLPSRTLSAHNVWTPSLVLRSSLQVKLVI